MTPKIPPSRSKAYTDAGVNIEAGNSLVDRIKKMATATHNHGVLSDIGGFGGLFKLDTDNVSSPVLVASTDGVGTKLKLAFAFNKHDTVGIDLVAMSVNDIIVQGAKPLFFLDYFATGKLDVDTAADVISGISEGCKRASCALLGGETAEMPGMYAEGEYDLAGFCVGVVDNSKIIDGGSIKAGDAIVGIASSGVHANGFSLVRKILDQSGLKADDLMPGTDRSVKDVLLEPTTIYVECIKNIMRNFKVNGMVHITGGGFYDNIPRVLPNHLKASINFSTWDIPPVFQWLQKEGNLSWEEMLQIFNCGIGYIIIIKDECAEDVLNQLKALNLPAWKIGSVEKTRAKSADRVSVKF